MLLFLVLLVLFVRETNMQRVLVATSCSASDNQVRKWRIENSNEIATTGQLLRYVASQLQVDEYSLQLEWMNPKVGKYEEITSVTDTIDLNFNTGFLLVTYKLKALTEREPLFIENRLFNFQNGFDVFNSINNVTQTIYLNEVQDADKGTGLKLWDSSIILSKYFEKNLNLLQNKRILELGCGIGSLGLSLSCLGAETVMLTDLEYTMANLEHNVKLNGLNNVETALLNWAKPETYPSKDFDIIVAADVVWLESLVPSLVMCMHTLALRSPITIYLSHQTRSKYTDELLFRLLENHFYVQEVPVSSYHADYRNHKIKIFKITLK